MEMNEADNNAPYSVLKIRRQELNLDIATVASELRISTATISALESGDYEPLPAKVFVRGYINSYCRLLGIDPRPILEEVGSDEKQVENKGVQPVVGNEHQLKMIRVWGTLAVGVFIGCLVLWSLYFDGEDTQLEPISEKSFVEPVAKKGALVPVREEKPEVEIIEVELENTVAESVLSPVTSVEDPLPLDFSESLFSSPKDERFPDAGFVSTPSLVGTSATPIPVVPVLGEDSSSLATATTEVALSVRSSRICWAHIVDGAGKTLLHRIMPADYKNSFRGVVPFHVRLGNAEFVTLVIDGKEVRVVRYMRPLGTANFKIFSADKIILQ